jgi:sarcosine oxidase gamma subunit
MRSRVSSYVAIALAVVVVAVAACGPSKSEPGTKSKTAVGAKAGDAAGAGVAAKAATEPSAAGAPAAAVDLSKGSCVLDIDGDVHAKVVSPGGPQAVGTDYWLTAEELDQAVEIMVTMMVKDKVKAAAAIEKAKKNEPRVMLLLLNCSDEKVKLTLSPGIGARYKNVPFGPGKYTITSQGSDTTFGAMFSIGHKWYHLDGTGTLDITRFDTSGITATIEFAAQNTDRATQAVSHVTVKGKLDFPCPPSSKACKH